MIRVPAHPGNYTFGRNRKVDRIVLHYTAGDGDTAEHNGAYFSSDGRKASAHYFVDETAVCASVPETDTAWHAGNWEMNERSIGVEMCSKLDADGKYYIPEATLSRTAELVRELMARYGLGPDAVLRHYDVTGKICPAPMVDDPETWQAFLERISFSNPSPWAENACRWAAERGIFLGDGQDYRWQDSLTREELAVILHRMQG